MKAPRPIPAAALGLFLASTAPAAAPAADRPPALAAMPMAVIRFHPVSLPEALARVPAPARWLAPHIDARDARLPFAFLPPAPAGGRFASPMAFYEFCRSLDARDLRVLILPARRLGGAPRIAWRLLTPAGADAAPWISGPGPEGSDAIALWAADDPETLAELSAPPPPRRSSSLRASPPAAQIELEAWWDAPADDGLDVWFGAAWLLDTLHYAAGIPLKYELARLGRETPAAATLRLAAAPADDLAAPPELAYALALRFPTPFAPEADPLRRPETFMASPAIPAEATAHLRIRRHAARGGGLPIDWTGRRPLALAALEIAGLFAPAETAAWREQLAYLRAATGWHPEAPPWSRIDPEIVFSLAPRPAPAASARDSAMLFTACLALDFPADARPESAWRGLADWARFYGGGAVADWRWAIETVPPETSGRLRASVRWVWALPGISAAAADAPRTDAPTRGAGGWVEWRIREPALRQPSWAALAGTAARIGAGALESGLAAGWLHGQTLDLPWRDQAVLAPEGNRLILRGQGPFGPLPTLGMVSLLLAGRGMDDQDADRQSGQAMLQILCDLAWRYRHAGLARFQPPDVRADPEGFPARLADLVDGRAENGRLLDEWVDRQYPRFADAAPASEKIRHLAHGGLYRGFRFFMGRRPVVPPAAGAENASPAPEASRWTLAAIPGAWLRTAPPAAAGTAFSPAASAALWLDAEGRLHSVDAPGDEPAAALGELAAALDGWAPWEI